MQFQRCKQVKRFMIAVTAIGLAVGAAAQAQADVVFSQNFDSGPGVPIGISPTSYWGDNANENGYIFMNSGQIAGRGDQIASDASGLGYFLYEGTSGDNNSGQNALYISPTFNVSVNTNYTASFALINQDPTNIAQIELQIGSQTFGPVSATGFGDGLIPPGWQTFSFAWNSGANTTAQVTFLNLVTVGLGNDFGIDNILVGTAVPEPSAFVLASVGALGMLVYSRLPRKARN